MKKSLAGLALLAGLSGAALAQSNVTIYGKIDMGLQKSNNGNATLAGATGPINAWSAEPGASSRIGFRGTEDLGGGMRATFTLENRFNPDTGQSQAPELFRHAWVELAGRFGELRLGRDFTPAFRVAIAGDPFGFDTVAQAGPPHVLLGLSPTRFSNMVQYKTPNVSGFTALVGIAPTENAGIAPGANGSTDKPFGFNISYLAGPLSAGLGYENAGVQSTLGVKTNLWVFSAAYDFGFVRPIFMYGKGTADALTGATLADRTEIQIGGTAPLGIGELKFLLAKRDDDRTNISIKKMGIGYHYPLSKRTKVYVDAASASETNRTRRTAFDFGVQHNF